MGLILLALLEEVGVQSRGLQREMVLVDGAKNQGLVDRHDCVITTPTIVTEIYLILG